MDLLAGKLVNSGVKQGSLIGMHIDRSLEMVISMLAILKAGAAYVPLDPSYPQDRLNYIVEDSGLAHLLISGENNITVGNCQVIDVKEFLSRGADNKPFQGNPTREDDLVYVMYTSGSTGKPKGVKVHQRAVVNFLKSMQMRPGLAVNDVVLNVTTPSFDISVLEVFLPLIVGSTLVVASREETIDGSKLKEIIQTFSQDTDKMNGYMNLIISRAKKLNIYMQFQKSIKIS